MKSLRTTRDSSDISGNFQKPFLSIIPILTLFKLDVKNVLISPYNST